MNIDPLRDPQGGNVGVINCLQDITDRNLSDIRQALLVNELNHRVKNTVATVQAIAARSLRDGASEETRKGFESRLMALSKAHDVLTAQNWERADLEVIVAGALAPFRNETKDRFELNGLSVDVEPGLDLSLAIALEELCTNVAKYGSLSPDSAPERSSFRGQRSNRHPGAVFNWTGWSAAALRYPPPTVGVLAAASWNAR